MLPAATIGQGGQIYYIIGARAIPANLQWMVVGDNNTPIYTVQGAAHANTSSTDFNKRFFGGTNSYWPASYANHRACIFYKNKLYYSANKIEGNGELYLARFDGSGILSYSDLGQSWKSGKGSEFLSPSGNSALLMRSSDSAFVEHNGNLIIVSATWGNPANEWDDTEWGWFVGSAGGSEQKDRVYRTFVINENDERIMSDAYSFSPDADFRDDNHMCDAISFQDDIYFGTWVDIGKIQGGSGNITLAESTPTLKSAKSFAIYPNGGYSNGTPINGAGLFCLSSSGVLKKVSPSGTDGVKRVVDLSDINDDLRNGIFTARYGSWTRNKHSTQEPPRAPLLLNFNNNLHAFLPTAASGFRHFVCSGNPSGISSWSENTTSMPTNFQYWDGNMFGYIDENRNKMVVAHYTMSEIGMFGHQGAQKSAGGINISEYNTDGVWTDIYVGGVGFVPRSLIPYNNVGPDVVVPSGSNPKVYKCSDYAVIEYTLYDHYGRDCNAKIEYSVNEGVTWSQARRFKSYSGTLLGSGTTNLPTSHFGTTYDFYWDYVNDVGFNSIKTCIIRITPRLAR